MFGFLEHHKVKCAGCENMVRKGVGDKRLRFHSYQCRRNYYMDQFKQNNPTNGLPTATVGAVGELKVALDLLTKGYHVFRSVSPSAPCDLLITKNGSMLRVEVKTAYRKPDGKMQTATIKKPYRFDILALAFKDGSIEYRPPLPDSIGPTEK